MKIAVLCGGLSAERDVSLAGGAMAARALRSRGHLVLKLDLFFGHPEPYADPQALFTQEDQDDAVPVGEAAPDLMRIRESRGTASRSRVGVNVMALCRAADIVFLALHGEDGEDGRIQAAFDLEGIKYTGTGQVGSTLAMNKAVSKRLFMHSGIRTPEGVVVRRGGVLPRDFGFPCVVKPCSRGSSVGASVVTRPQELDAAAGLAFAYDDAVIVERYIKGRECDVGVLAGRALPVIEICPKSGFYDYRNKYQSGLADEYCPANLPADIAEELRRTAERVFETLMFDVYGRMDFIVDERGGVWCLEGNTLPGLTATSLLPQEAAAAGMSYEDLCEAIVYESLKKYEGDTP